MLRALLRQVFGRRAAGAVAEASPAPRDEVLEQARALSADGKLEAAEAALDRILAVDPERVDALLLRSKILRKGARLPEAKYALETALTLDPMQVEGWLDLATCYRLEGDLIAARVFLRFANVVDRTNAQVANELGLIDITLGNFEQAEESLVNAVNWDPELAEAWNNLGMTHARRGDRVEARRHFLRAVFLKPDFYMANCNLGLASRDLERFEDAERELRHAVTLDPCPTAARLNLAGVLQDVGRLDEARAVLDTAHAQAPQDADVLAALSALWLRLGDGAAAERCAREALEHSPESPDARLALAHAQLASADYEQGWENYEARLRGGLLGQRQFPIPAWRGEDLQGKRLFVYGEQGLGDEIMFASCIPDLVARGAHCVLDCSPRLRGLMRRSFPSIEVLERLADPDSPEVLDAQVDLCVPIGSLPRWLRGARAAFPGTPYLRADPARVEAWRARLGAPDGRLRVGLSWRGGLARTGRALRSLDAPTLQPLLETPGVRWISLQHDARDDELAALDPRNANPLEHWREAHADLDETAALMCGLDLIVTACSTVVHLAGALGRPAWVLTPHGAAWRYGLSGSAMPWYGSVSLLRQTTRERWDDVLATVRERIALRPQPRVADREAAS